MFTGIVQTTGRIRDFRAHGNNTAIVVDGSGLDAAATRVGDSVNVSGCCLTVVAREGDGLCFDLSRETLSRTRFGELKPGDRVNLETAVTAATPLGGHFVTGHIDGLGEVVARVPAGRAEQFRFALPAALARYVAAKGSICIDGVSLTVNDVAGSEFGITLIPHTLAVTTLGGLAVGARVHVEIDLLARYLERLLEARTAGLAEI